MKKRIVIALGGNALGENLAEQKAAVRSTSAAIADLIEEGHEIVIVHGNGPQVGMINLAFETAAKADPKFEVMPMPVCVALSQGYIGNDLQNAIKEELTNRNIDKPVAAVITQAVVDVNDPAFQNPTKPIGSFYTKEESEALEKAGETMMEDAGRGYRRVIASPKPIDIVEKGAVLAILEAGGIPIAVGGGGIPVSAHGNGYKGEVAVIDKDWAGAKLAEIIDADMFIILTAVEKVAINFGKENQEWLDSLTIERAHELIAENHFAKGSMLPKVEAAIEFASKKKGNSSLITMLQKAKEGIAGKTGTVIEN